MRLRTIVLAGAAALFITPAFAGEGWYLGLGAGWDQAIGPKVAGFGIDGKLKTRDSALVLGTFGYQFASPFRLEAEIGWDRHKVESLDDAGLVSDSSGHVEVKSFLVNGIYDLRLLPRLKLSLGAGAGFGQDPSEFTDVPAALAVSTGSRTHFMWQGIGGFSFAASRNIDLFVEYHYRDLKGSSNDIAASTVRPHDLAEHAVIAGFRWYPWAPEERVAYQAPPAPPPPPPAPPPPVAPAPVKTFIVFFDFNKSNLTTEAQGVVADAVKTAQQTGSVRILITGHTDTVGSDVYNQALSERRAAAVKDEMVREGLGADEISTVGKSFHDPLVATGPGVREPQNRRAVIDLGNG